MTEDLRKTLVDAALSQASADMRAAYDEFMRAVWDVDEDRRTLQNDIAKFKQRVAKILRAYDLTMEVIASFEPVKAPYR